VSRHQINWNGITPTPETPATTPANGNEIQCFMLERTNLFREELRRYAGEIKCEEHPYKYHNAEVVICETREVPEIVESECGGGDAGCFGIHLSHDDDRWPKACCCGYEFQIKDTWQHHFHRLYRTPDGRLLRPEESPPGGMFYSDWWPHPSHVDGHCLSVVLPPDGHIWMVEGHANNCNVPNSFNDRSHFCWCRHRNPDGTFTVDNKPEPGTTTCTAGGGSILTPKWHGFLRNGKLVTCR